MNSPIPPSEEESDNELLKTYRSVSARDRRVPNPRVQQAILEHAARVATARRRSRRERYFDWRWKAAASLALVGLVGVLTLQNLRSPHEAAAPVTNARNAETAATTETSGTTATRGQAPSRQDRAAEVANDLSPEASQLRLQQPAARMAPASPASPPLPSPLRSPSAAVSGASAEMARARSPAYSEERSRYWLDKVIAALHLKYPELFSDAPVDAVRSGVRHDIRIALVLNEDGTVYKSALEGAADAQHRDPTARLYAELGVKPEELAVPVQTYYLDRTRDAPGDIVVTLGVLRGDPGTAQPPDQ